MEENKKQKNNKILKACGILGLFLIVFGVTYALFRVTLNGTKKNRITTGTLSLRLLDENDNYIDDLNPNADTGYSLNLTNAVPEIYEDAIAREDNIYTFKLKNEGTVKAQYDISLEDLALEAGESRLADDFVAYEIERLVNDSNPEQYEFVANGYNLTDLTDRIITTGIIAPQETYVFRLRLWIDDDTVTEENQAEAMNKVFNARLKVNGVQTKKDKEFDVNIENINVIATGGNPTFNANPTVSSNLSHDNVGRIETTLTMSNIQATLYHPGDSVSMTFDIVNNSIFDMEIDSRSEAKINGFVKCLNKEISEYPECAAWDSDESGDVTKSDKLFFNRYPIRSLTDPTFTTETIPAGAKKTITLEASFGTNNEDPNKTLPIWDGDITFVLMRGY